MRRFWRVRPLQRLRSENWRALGLLLAAYTVLVLGVTGTVTGLGFGLLFPPILLGLALGWSLAASRVSGHLAAILSLLIAPTLILIQIGNLGPSLAALFISFAKEKPVE